MHASRKGIMWFFALYNFLSACIAGHIPQRQIAALHPIRLNNCISMALRHLVRVKVKIPSYRGKDRRSTPHRDTRHRSRTYRKHSAHSTQGRTSGCHTASGQFRKGRPGCGSVMVHRAIPTKFLYAPCNSEEAPFLAFSRISEGCCRGDGQVQLPGASLAPGFQIHRKGTP
jgi:hypothetical protein